MTVLSGAWQAIGGATKKILVADDDPIIIKLLQVNLELEGYEVVCARDGQDAVEKAQAELPDLIVLDIMMPRMDGWSARAALLDIPSLRDTPVIFVSARAQQADLKRGYESGVAGYITKPFDPMDLLATIEQVLGSSPGTVPDDTNQPEANRNTGAAQPGAAGSAGAGPDQAPGGASAPAPPASADPSSPQPSDTGEAADAGRIESPEPDGLPDSGEAAPE